MKRQNISKNDVSKEIYASLGIPISYTNKLFDFIIDAIVLGLIKDDKVKISGFGTFKILHKKKRIGRNPKTKIEYEIKERKTVSFYPSKEVGKFIND